MTVPSYPDTVTLPLSSDALIERRVGDLIGRACRRQLWLLFLDADSVQMPMIVAIDDHPLHPDDSVTLLADRVRTACVDQGARSVIAVLERYASSDLTAADLAWARALTDEFAAAQVPLRGVLLSHRRGVRWLAPDDYLF